MAGLAAAARATQAGASVLLVEKSPAVGGSAQYASFLWTAPTVAVMDQVNPTANRELAAAVVRDYEPAIAWVADLGVDLKEPVELLGFGVGRQTDVVGLLAACERTARRGNAPGCLTSTEAVELIVDESGVRGAVVETPEGRASIRAGAVVLASGGFGGDADLRERLVHPAARDITLRANPFSRGDGMRLATSAGAATELPDAGFYGHLIPSRISYDAPHEFTLLTFYHSEHGVLLNLDGDRFCDESEGDHLSTLAVLDQPEARALLVTDQRVHEEWMLQPYVKGIEAPDKFALAYRRGARCATADDLAELRHLPDDWGYSGDRAYATLTAFNEQARAGAHQPSRRRDAATIDTPPFYVIEVVPALTFTFEGIRIDPRGAVLDDHGAPIPGLFAAGADAGGTFHRAYAGGLVTALVQGLRAAETVTAGSAAAVR